MRQYLLIYARADTGASVESRTEAIREVLANVKRFSGFVFPATTPTRMVEWISTNGQVAAVAVSNEQSGLDYDIEDAPEESTFFGVEGYVITDSQIGSLRYSHNPLETSVKCGGCFTLYRATDHGISAVTDMAGTGNASYATSSRFRIISNRSLWAHLVAESDDTRHHHPVLRFDDFAVRNLANSGSVQGNRTLFAGVSLMRRRSQVSATGWAMEQTSLRSEIPDSYPNWQPSDVDLDKICDALIEAFTPLQGSDLNLSLTGGRDSRMLLAAAQHIDGLQLKASTAGEPDHPDVQIAESLASILHIPHSRIAPPRSSPSVLLSEPIHSRIARVLDGHDWNLSAWDDMPDYGDYSPRPSMSGVGGEGLRGGIIMPKLLIMDAERVAAYMRNQQAGSPGLFRPHVNESAGADAYRWQELARYDPYAAADLYYKDERSNRWATSRRAAARLRTNAVDPLFDNRFVAAFDQIPAIYRWSERLAHDIIQRLAPAIASHPLEGHPWKFEAQSLAEDFSLHAPTRVLHQDAPGASRRRVSAWKTLESPTLYASMVAYIKDHMDGPIANVVDPEGVDILLQGSDRVRPTLLWNLATVATAVSTKTLSSSRTPLTNNVEVRDAPGLAST